MGRTLTNNFSLAYAIETALGVPGTTWKQVEPNSIGSFGAEITTVSRTPISKNRQARKGTIVDLNSTVDFDADLTREHFKDFIEGFVFANFTGAPVRVPTAVTGGVTDEYTVPDMGTTIAENTLVYARGFAESANNGLKVVDTGGTTTTIPVKTDLEDETPTATQNVSVEIAGYRSAVGDFDIDASGDLTSAASVFTSLDLEVGQMIWIGGEASINQFTNSANKGYTRITAIEAGKLTLDKKSQTFVTEANTTQEVEIYYGEFLKNVPVDDSNHLERSFHFEGAYENLDEPGPGDQYKYAKGNYCNTLGFNLPLTDKASLSLGFVGTDTEPPTTSRATGADAPIVPVQTAAYNTSSNIVRLRIQELDETGITTDFKNVTLTLNNNVTPEKVLATLGAKYLNTGIFEVTVEGQLVYTNSAVADAVRNNTTLTMDFVIDNDDGAIMVDIPNLTLGGGGEEFPVNESILINTTATAFGDPTFNASIMVSLFPFVPEI